jgi:hypothetical protein
MAMGGQPVFPDDAARLATPDNAYGVFVSGVHAYLANGLSGLRVVNVSDPSELTEVGSLKMLGPSKGVFIFQGNSPLWPTAYQVCRL